MSTTRTMTEAELMALPRDGFKREFVDGEIQVSPAGGLLDAVGEPPRARPHVR